jgi:hypothetical protein
MPDNFTLSSARRFYSVRLTPDNFTRQVESADTQWVNIHSLAYNKLVIILHMFSQYQI